MMYPRAKEVIKISRYTSNNWETTPFNLAHVRAYACKNLLESGATIYYQTPSKSSDFTAQNIISNFENRSSSSLYNGRTSNAAYNFPDGSNSRRATH